MSAPAVSVIMNCYNGEKELPEALESVRKQTFQDWEIVFWDNCSDDNSAEIARAWGPKLRYFKSGSTVPLGAARNLAISQARSPYIAFLDCDDLWLPDKLQKQVSLFEANPRLGLACTDTLIMRDGNVLSRVFENSQPERGMVFDALMRRQWISMSSAMIARSALDNLAQDASWFDERLNVCEEADVFYRLTHDWEADYIDEPLTVWRVHGDNTTFRKFSQFAAETRLILAKHRQLYPNYDQEHRDTVTILEARADFQEAIACWREGNGKKARQLVWPWVGKSPKHTLFWGASFLPGSLFATLAKIYFKLPGKIRRS